MVDTWDDDEDFLVVGIDFGTTFSGVAWALSSKAKDVDILTGWDSEIDHNEGSAKVPTRISYDRQTKDVAAWGFDHSPADVQFSWYKLLLCDETKRRAASQREFLDKLEADMKIVGKKPIDLAADYLQHLWEHASDTLKSRFGETYMETIQIKLVLTVPAMWDHQAQELTKKAAKMAGFGRRGKTKMELCSEPEAAARYVFSENVALRIGDAFTVCDAGGGTIDLISYKVEQLDPLRLKMCTEATGDLYGAVFLDNAFERQVKTMIGDEAYSDLSARNKKKMMGDWEHGIKRNFKHNQRADKDWVVDIPGYPGLPAQVPPPPYSPHLSPTAASRRRSAQILTPQTTGGSLAGSMRGMSLSGGGGERGEPGVISFKTTDLNAIFAQVCPRIIELVRDQVDRIERTENKLPRAIFLVGGFGANKYLKEEMKLSFQGIEIQQPKDAWSAICRGAVLKGMSDDTVINHISKYHYGLHFQERFSDAKHLARDKVWDQTQCEWKAHNQMRWYISKGDNIAKTDPVRHSWFQALTDSSQLRSIDTTIYFCKDETAPSRRSSEVLTLCKLSAQFDTSVWDELPETTNANGVKYRKLDYSIEMKVSSSGLDWLLHYEGMEKGRATIAPDFFGNPQPGSWND